MHGGDIYSHRVELDFSVNVNPIELPESVKEALRLASEECTKYPDIENRDLKKALAEFYCLKEDNLILGNGASELFMAIMHAYKPKSVLMPAPCYTGYEHVIKAIEAKTVYYKTKEEDGYRLTEDFLKGVDTKVDMVILTNPGNPVGSLIDADLLTEILDKCISLKIPVIMDECFIEFTGKEENSCITKIEEYPNLILVRAFTKFYSMPGVRLGFAVTSNELAKKQLQNQLPEWNISIFAARAGVAALNEKTCFASFLPVMEKEKALLSERTGKLGMAFYPSDANFLMFKSKCDIHNPLLNRGILIRELSDVAGLSKGHYRLGIKMHEDNVRLTKALEEICL